MKKLPVFVFTKYNVLGKKLLEQTDQTCDSLGRKLLKTGRYDCFLDCNGARIIKSNHCAQQHK